MLQRTPNFVAMAMALAMLQQRWHCELQRYWCRGKLLQRWRCCYNAVVVARCGNSAATLLLQSVEALLVQRVAALLLQRWRYWCGAAGAAALLLVRGAAAAATAMALRRCCSAVLPRRCGAADFIFIFIFYDSRQVQESSTSLHVRARNIEQEGTREL